MEKIYIFLVALAFSACSFASDPIADSGRKKCVDIRNGGDLEGAITCFDKLVKTYPNEYLVYTGRAVASLKKGNIDDAISDYSRAIELNPDNEALYGLRGKAFGLKKDHERAIEDFSEAIILNPQETEFFLLRGTEYYLSRKYNLAYRNLSVVVTREPNNAEALFFRGLVNNFMNKPDRVIEDLDKAIGLGYKVSDAYAVRGSAHCDKSHFKQCRADYDEAIKLDPDNPIAKEGLAKLKSKPEKRLQGKTP